VSGDNPRGLNKQLRHQAKCEDLESLAMSVLTVVENPAADERTSQTWGRLQELFGDDPIPEAFRLYARVPAFLQDFYMNFKKFVWSAGQLDVRTKSIIGLAVSHALKSPDWSVWFVARLRKLGESDQLLADVIGVTATCEMYNVFFKFRDLAGTDIYAGMGVGLRAHTFSNTSLDDKLVELINVAISDLNGCKPCTSGHIEKARQLGVSHEALLEVIQCTACLKAGISFLNAAA